MTLEDLKLRIPTDFKTKFVYFVILPWAVFITVTTFEFKSFAGRGDRFTYSQSLELEKRLIAHIYQMGERIDGRIDGLPPEVWQDLITDTRLQLRTLIDETRKETAKLQQMLHQFERNFSKDFIRKNELRNLLPLQKQDQSE